MINTGLRLARAGIHFLSILGVFFVSYKLRLITDLIPGIQLRIPPINANELMLFAGISASTFLIIGITKKLYELEKPIRKHAKTFSKVRIYRFVSITFIAYFGWGFIFPGGISRFIIVIASILTFFTLFIFDQTRNAIEAKNHRNSNHKILIVAKKMSESYNTIEKIKQGFSFKTELIEIDEIEKAKMPQYKIVIAVGNYEKTQLQIMYEHIRLSDTKFFHVSEGYFLEDVVYTQEHIDEIIALEYKHSKIDGRARVFKKAFDIIGAAIGIAVFSPVMLAIAIIIKIDSPGPIFFCQKRIGKNEKPFTFIKFRSMIANADSLKKKLLEQNERKGPLFKIKNDPRITKIGKFLRKTSLDELPNLFSVFVGSMSLVGPRPHLAEEIEKYSPQQKRLLSIRPGVTGYAQIFGRDNLNFDEEARLDLYYIQNRSPLLDIYIIFGTFGVVFKGK